VPAQHWQHRSGHREQTEYVGLEHGAGLGERGLLDRAEQAGARVADQDVDPAEPGQCRIGHLGGALLVGHVLGEGEQPFVAAEVEPARVAGGSHHRVALGKRLADELLAEAARRPGHQPDPHATPPYRTLGG
jgi:hypothetical protein